MSKRLLLCILVLTAPLSIAQDTESKIQEQESATQIHATIDELFDDRSIAQLPVPVFVEPSSFVIWLRSTGLAILDKCLALKVWIVKKYRYLFSKPRSTQLP